MSTDVTLPALGESVTEGTISRWLKQVGDTVEVDEPIVEVSTDKVDTEIPSPAAGVLSEIRAEEDETVEVGQVLCVVGGEVAGQADDAPVEEQPSAADAPAEESVPEAPAAPEARPAAPQSGGATSEVTLPALGESVTEGTVSRWLKAVGDAVEVDEPLLEVSTDKVDTEIPSPFAGTLVEIRVAEDEVAQVGDVLGLVGDGAAGGEEPAEAPQESAPAQAVPAETAKRGDDGETDRRPAVAKRASEPAEGSDDIYVTPLVRRMAAERGVDLTTLVGTGVGGRIRKQDVIAAAEGHGTPVAAPTPTPQSTARAQHSTEGSAPAKPEARKSAPTEASQVAGTTEKMSRLRKTIATRMVESLRTSAQLTATVEADLTPISRIRSQVKEAFRKREGVGLSYLPFITKATVEVLKEFPIVNATIDEDEGTITYADAENVGIAVDTEKGLLVPVIKDCGDYNIAGLARKIHDLADRTRTNRVTPDELTGGTFTITNYGSAGTLFDTPIINLPQVAILGTGALVKRPVVMQDKNLGETIAVRDMMYLSLTYDHRVIDGAVAARFLSAIKERLEEGDFGAEFGL